MSLTPGSRLGVYDITAQIGVGGMGEVYRATDTNLKRQVAIKVLPASVAGDTDRLARFQREAEVLAALNHPNIAAIYGLEKTPDFTALVMELVEGEDLSQRTAKGAIPLDEALPIAKQIAEALEAAHEQGIIHRDLKPANIKVRPDGTVKVLDFGLAKAMDPPAGSSPNVSQSPTLSMHATQAGMILGTAAYMSPEQARGQAVDKRADIWAFGVVLFETLSGRSLFAADTVSDTLAGVLKNEIDLAKLPPGTPPALRQLLRRCLERNPKNRLRDVGEARLLLEELLTGQAQGTPPATTPRPAPSRRAVIALATTAAAFALLFAGSLLLRRPSAPSGPAPEVVRFPLVADPALVAYTELTMPFAVSPDGRTVVFVAAPPGGPYSLYARTLDDPRPRRIEGTENGQQPAISPNGEWVAFLVRASQIRKVRLTGGPAIDVTAIPNVSAALAWASDDELLYEMIGTEDGIHRVGASGSRPERLLALDASAGEVRQRRPFVLRSERLMIYESTTRDGRTTLAVTSLADGRRARLEIEGIQALGTIDGRLIYSRADGNLMAVPFDAAALRVTGPPVELADRVEVTSMGSRVALSAGGTLVYRTGSSGSRLALVDAKGAVSLLGELEGGIGAPRVSPDGRRIAVAMTDGSGSTAQSDLWLFDRSSGQATRLTRTGHAAVPEWTADGRRLLFVSHPRGGRSEIWTLPLDGSAGPSRLVETEGTPLHAVQAPDGQSVVAVLALPDSSHTDLVRIPIGGGVPALLAGPSLAGSAQGPSLPRISPDGRLVAFVDNTTWEIFVQQMDGTSAIQVTDAGGWLPSWSADGRRLYWGGGTQLAYAEIASAGGLTVAARHTVATLPFDAESCDLVRGGETFVCLAPYRTGSEVLVAAHWADEIRRLFRRVASTEGAR